MKIDAAVLRAADGPYAIEEVELPDPGPGQILVKVAATGMCHTDVVPRAGMTELVAPPIITGHEGSGVVEALGEGVSGIEVGDHVVLSFDSCGTCDSCTRGLPSYCEQFIVRNLSGRNADGGGAIKDSSGDDVLARWFGQSSFATYALATERNAVVVDKDLPLEKLAPLGCGIQTGAATVLVALDVQPDTSIVVYGTGAVGLAAVMAAKVAGASTIVAVDLNDERLELAKELGATHAVRGDADDLLAQLQEITGGGSRYAVETTGVPAVMLTAVDALRLGGTVGWVGVQTGELTLQTLTMPGKTAIGILMGGSTPQTIVPRMIELWQDGQFPFDRLIEEFPLSQINEAEQAALGGKVLKPVLVPGG